MQMKEKEEISPGLVKFGVALALSLGGIFYSLLRAKRVGSSQSPPSPTSPDSENRVGSGGEGAGHKNDSGAAAMAQQEHDSLSLSTDNSLTGLSPSGRSNGDKDGYLLPEFNELVKDFDIGSMEASNSPKKDVETLVPDMESPTGYKVVKKDDHEQEIKNLRNMVKILKERERALEIQLLEYYGLKEQETAVMELHNRLKINNVEAKLFTLKIESLQADNRRLEAQVADHAKVVAELEAARVKIKLLKRKLRFDAKQNKEQILALQQGVAKLQEQEQMAAVRHPDIQPKLQKLKDLEEEVEELRKSNYKLQLENSELGRRLDYAQILATSVLENEETEALKEDNQLLKKQNEDLTNEIEQLQEDRCADAEELVYLRWINACLRYELRNYHPGPGETAARDLSKTLSPKSEERAKQLILEYANKEGPGERGVNNVHFDLDQSSSSQASYHTDSGDLDDSPVTNSISSKPNTSSKRKIFGKLIKVLRGHGHHHGRGSSLEVNAAVEDVAGRDSPMSESGVSTATDGQSNKSRTTSSLSSSRLSLESSSRRSLESSGLSLDLNKSPYIQRLKNGKMDNVIYMEGGQKHSDGAGSSYAFKKIDSILEDAADSPDRRSQHNRDIENDKKSNLLKYAEALLENHGKSPELLRRSASFDSVQ